MIPPKIVLAAVDFSEGARVALGLAARLARQAGATLHVLHAEDPLLAAAARHQGLDLGGETWEELQRFVAAAPPAADCQPQIHAVTGAAADVILEVARREHADLIAVGSRGMSGAERLMFGSTAERVLRRADVSVLVVPPAWTHPQPTTRDLSGTGPVIAGIDFSASSTAAGGAACRMAAMLGTSLEAVHIVPSGAILQRWKAHADDAVSRQVAEARRELETIGRTFGPCAPIELLVEAGNVPERLAARGAPTGHRHPVLVLGRRAGGSRGAVPGAVANRVLTLAPVPVLVYLERS